MCRIEEVPSVTQSRAQSNSSHSSRGLDSLSDSMRKREISSFMERLEDVMHKMNSKQAEIQSIVKNRTDYFQEQSHRIVGFYEEIYQKIEEHKHMVLEALEEDAEASEAEARHSVKIVQESAEQAQEMWDDISGSMEVIRDVEEDSFRPVMDSYEEKLATYEEQLDTISLSQVPGKVVSTRVSAQSSAKIIELIELALTGSQGHQALGASSLECSELELAEPSEQSSQATLSRLRRM